MNSRLRSVVAALVCLAPLTQLACSEDSSPSPVTHLYFSQDGNANGLYELDQTTGAATLVGSGATGTTAATIGLTETASAGMLIGSTWSDIAQINADGSSATVLPNSAEAEALAMNTATGVLFGGINGAFFTVNPTTGVRVSTLAAPGADIEGLAADPLTNVVYGIGVSDQNLYVYDVTTGQWDVVGSTGRDWLDSGLAYDHLAGVLYAIDNTTDALYRINPTTAATSLVGSLGTDAAGGLAFVVE